MTAEISRNIATDEGREIGNRMAQWCDEAEPKARLKYPEIPPRCSSCAFRAGNHLANGSPQTQMDALKCTMEQTPFYCHDVHRPEQICSGWLMMRLAHDDAPMQTPWEFCGGKSP